MKPLVSVVIPAYNMGDFVGPCINSVLNQNYTNFEIIIVNDGSHDNTETICSEFAKQNSNVLLITQENQGVSVARNNGIAMSHGDYILFLDADDTLPPNAINDLVVAAQKYNSDMTIGKMSPEEEMPIGIFTGEEFLIKCLEDSTISHFCWRILFKREFLKDITFPKGIICGEDSYMVFKCAAKKPTVATINECVYKYTANPNSVTRSTFTHKRYDSLWTVLNKKEAIISNDFPHLLDLFYHLKVKTLMRLLAVLSNTKGTEFKKEERETLLHFNNVKSFFRANLDSSNADFYNILSNNGYFKYKLKLKLKHMIRNMLNR